MNKPATPNTKSVSSYCYQCVAGPDLMKVDTIDGVPVQIRPNDAAADVHPAHGKVCVKAFGLTKKKRISADEAECILWALFLQNTGQLN